MMDCIICGEHIHYDVYFGSWQHDTRDDTHPAEAKYWSE